MKNTKSFLNFFYFLLFFVSAALVLPAGTCNKQCSKTEKVKKNAGSKKKNCKPCKKGKKSKSKKMNGKNKKSKKNMKAQEQHQDDDDSWSLLK